MLRSADTFCSYRLLRMCRGRPHPVLVTRDPQVYEASALNSCVTCSAGFSFFRIAFFLPVGVPGRRHVCRQDASTPIPRGRVRVPCSIVQARLVSSSWQMSSQAMSVTRPVSRLYKPPATFNFPPRTASPSIGLVVFSFATLNRTFCCMALSSKSPNWS